MGLFSIFSKSEAKGFAEELAQNLTKDLPPKLILKSSNVISANRVSTILERTYAKATDYQIEKGMSAFQRPGFANAFRWKLKDLGYPDEFVGVATEGLLVQLSRSKSSDS